MKELKELTLLVSNAGRKGRYGDILKGDRTKTAVPAFFVCFYDSRMKGIRA
jgi:hypothetical protein